ncbi:VOC family protein [Paraburkholderia aspalathi]|nr:VOC family protein [Paraburkholderia aspalathi]
MSKIVPCLWFDGQAEEAARFYISLLPDSHIDAINNAPVDYPGGSKGNVLTVEFTLAGQKYIGLNGGPYCKFNEAVSFQIYCKSQSEVDRLSDALSAVPEAEQCGWVKDRFGLSWQIVPEVLMQLMGDSDTAKATRVMEAMMAMKRINISAIRAAAEA